ncbi:GNAT family N-acetyltransferase [Metasolibacillus sp.]|uniref:GNAT family N-acetyltransferase n=1 Tax=Metasolibacillus sp. TaxID=2703680 RepID=UPI0025F67B02|nr:GNAT family N-acetyltransferase [Metasolibacillus sp.]MCT6925878.1 GNAT family N-acetyltransferase [Metasolibacillus sp.]MCT6942088.1 GNAT family N-acetyltransferase [Metasolibacillus sp.]
MFQVHSALTKEQLQRAFDIRTKVFVEEQGVPVHLELDEFDQTADHFIVMDGEQTIAAARLREYEPLVGKVERVCVLNEYRGQRLGFLLMEHIEQVAKEKGWKKLKLNAQSYAVPFYEKLHYTVTSPEFLDAGIPHRAMEKSI